MLRARGLSALAQAIAPVLAAVDRPNAGPFIQRVWPLLEMASELQSERAFAGLLEGIGIGTAKDGTPVAAADAGDGGAIAFPHSPTSAAPAEGSTHTAMPTGGPMRSIAAVPPTVRGLDVSVFHANTSSPIADVLAASLFRQLFERLFSADAATWRLPQPFFTRLGGRQAAAIDNGGICRDVLSHVGAEMMAVHNGGTFMMNPLFTRCDDGGSLIIPAPMDYSATDPTHRPMLVFFGRLLGHFLLTEDVLPADFPLFFWYALLYRVVRPELLRDVCPAALATAAPDNLRRCAALGMLEDLEDVFPHLANRHRQLQRLARATSVGDNGAHHERGNVPADAPPPLPPLSGGPGDCLGDAPHTVWGGDDGASYTHVSTDAAVYAQLSQECASRLAASYAAPIAYVRVGLLEVLNSGGHGKANGHGHSGNSDALLQSLLLHDAIARVCGTSAVTTMALKAVTSHSMAAPMAAAFWEAVDRMTSEERGQLLQFGTGRRRLPMPAGERLTVVAVLEKGALPTAHTCSGTIRLPSVCDSPDEMYRVLSLALASEFAFA